VKLHLTYVGSKDGRHRIIPLVPQEVARVMSALRVPAFLLKDGGIVGAVERAPDGRLSWWYYQTEVGA